MRFLGGWRDVLGGGGASRPGGARRLTFFSLKLKYFFPCAPAVPLHGSEWGQVGLVGGDRGVSLPVLPALAVSGPSGQLSSSCCSCLLALCVAGFGSRQVVASSISCSTGQS